MGEFNKGDLIAGKEIKKQYATVLYDLQQQDRRGHWSWKPDIDLDNLIKRWIAAGFDLQSITNISMTKSVLLVFVK
tara:strand:+ start:58 stop:285 length:228 start_codon:yes stop_codon:yes gene_type:complete